MQDRLSEMDGTWHSDSKLKAVMTASGKDRFSVNSTSYFATKGVARCDMSVVLYKRSKVSGTTIAIPRHTPLCGLWIGVDRITSELLGSCMFTSRIGMV